MQRALQAPEHEVHLAQVCSLATGVRETFAAFGIPMNIADIALFPDGILVALAPAVRVRMHVISEFEDDIRFALGLEDVTIEAPLPGKRLVGVMLHFDVAHTIFRTAKNPKGIPSPWGYVGTDALYDEAKRLVTAAGKVSVPMLRRMLGIDHARAVRLLLLLEAQGIVGPQQGDRPRDVYGS